MYHTITYNSGRIAILSDPHVDSYESAGSDFVTAHGLASVLNGSLDALIIAGDLTNGPLARWKQSLDHLTPVFHSDMTDMIESFEPDAWFFGHSHRRLRVMVGRTDVRNMSVGYPGEFHLSESGYLIDACVWKS